MPESRTTPHPASVDRRRSYSFLRRTALVVLATAAIIGAGILFLPPPKESIGASSLSLSLVRRGTEFGYRPELVFLRLTNQSDSTFLVSMTGDTNTFEGSMISESSCMLNGAIGEQRVDGTWTNLIQLPAAVRGNRAYVSVAPFSGMLVRMLLPVDGRVRRVGVVCEKLSPPGKLDKFFGTSIGRATMKLLPISVLRKLSAPPPPTIIWCVNEISCVEALAGGR